ncbi:MAG TPA: hypothetical protein VGH28_21070 [Polyangiaceae bacterium]
MRFVAALVFVMALLAPATARATTLASVVTEVGDGLGAGIPSGALVVAAPLETDVAPVAGRADELALRFGALLAGRFTGAHAAARVASLDDARAMAARATRLVYVRVQIVKGQLRVTADAYPVVRNVWDRARLPPPPPNGHAYAAAPIDAEVRAFFPPIPLAMTNVVKATGADADVLAVACGDLDGDGAPEILLVSRERVALARIASGKVVVARTAPWSALGKRAPVPLREPLGGAAIEVGRAFVGSSDRGGFEIGEALDAPRALSGGLPIGADMCAPISTSRLAFEGVVPCSGNASRGARESYDAASAFDLVTPDGRDRLALATTEGGKLSLRVDGIERATFDEAGAQVVVFDADLDGAPEIAFGSDAPEDFLTIATLGERGPRVLSRIPAAAGVRALGACGGALVAVVGTEVWLVR